MRYIYGYCNCAYYNVNPEGDLTWFTTRKARDCALARIREKAVDDGLSPGASRAGIYPVDRHVASMTGQAFVRALEDRGLLHEGGAS
jgi:hypothetical protein